MHNKGGRVGGWRTLVGRLGTVVGMQGQEMALTNTPAMSSVSVVSVGVKLGLGWRLAIVVLLVAFRNQGGPLEYYACTMRGQPWRGM